MYASSSSLRASEGRRQTCHQLLIDGELGSSVCMAIDVTIE
jgi:hypothetical protein